MNTIDIIRDYEKLCIPSNTIDAYDTVFINESKTHLLAKGINSNPIFLFKSKQSADYTPSLNFRYFTVDFNISCKVKIDSDDKNINCCIIRLLDDDSELSEIFIRCVLSFSPQLSDEVSAREINNYILDLMEIFQGLKSLGDKDINGLWGELFVINSSLNIESLIDSWHSRKFDTYDFTFYNNFVEVKSACEGMRRHFFSLDQLVSSIDGAGYVFSLLLKKSQVGLSIYELAELIEGRLENSYEHIHKLWKVIMNSLGGDFDNVSDIRFDMSYAKDNLLIFSFDDIPKPDINNDGRISNVKFQSDISNLKSSVKFPANMNFIDYLAG